MMDIGNLHIVSRRLTLSLRLTIVASISNTALEISHKGGAIHDPTVPWSMVLGWNCHIYCCSSSQ
jgi:hypothetical protein